jgi:hypothetical protein
MRAFWISMFISFLIVSAFMVPITCLVIFAESRSCANRSVSFDEYKWKFFGGCMVKYKDMWINYDNAVGIILLDK